MAPVVMLEKMTLVYMFLPCMLHFFVRFVTIIILLYDRVSQGVRLLSDKLYSSK